jgi:hypothetical protein
MLPAKIHFTDLELDPEAVLTPRKMFDGTYPSTWVRHQFDLPLEAYGHLRNIDRWIEANLEGRWGSYSVYTFGAVTFVIAFERVTDAMMFRLRGGEQTWRPDQKNA